MSPTVADVVALSDLDLRVLAGHAALDAPVRWVAISELADPGPYLEGGELVLTTGMRLRSKGSQLTEYVECLTAAGASGLGLAVGLTHTRVPAELVRAAETASLPLLEVPMPTPFIAITKAVSSLITAQEYAELANVFAVQRDLIRASLQEQPSAAAAIAKRVAAALGPEGFALLLDRDGGVVSAAPPSARRRAAALSEHLNRLRAQGMLASASLSDEAGHVTIQPLGVDGRANGFFAVGSPGRQTTGEVSIINLAVSLLSAGRATAADRPSSRAVRSAALAILLDHGVDATPVVELGWPTPRSGDVVAVVRAEANVDEDVIGSRIPRSIVALDRDHGDFVVVGSESAPWADLPAAVGMSVLDGTETASLRRAVSRARAAIPATGVRSYGDVARGRLSELLDGVGAPVDEWAVALLDRLVRDGERADLVATVRAWLRHHGHIDSAATELGVHRHTVRHRLARVESLLGRTLDDPTLRAELWLALSRT